MSPPFWLRIVSIAIAVLPVWRSPMISSRWPRPIGIIVSIGLMPVCIGSCTDFLAMIPGALISICRRSDASIGPLPSTGSPSAFTTRPSMASPTGTSAMRPVRRAVSPSRMCSLAPIRAIPTLFSSRLRTIPLRFPANSISSPAWAFSRPYTRAMPSPTVSTEPVSATSTFLS